MEEKIAALLTELTLEEKATLLAGADMWHTVSIERLGIPSIQLSDGPNGVRGADDNLGEPSVCFPVGVAMGATWNRALIEAVGADLAAQVRLKGAHVLLAPTVNIPRTPLAGRNFECFSEDPFLSGTIAAAYINGLQQQGVAACIKHFAVNDQEFERFSISAEVSERPLHEIYLEPFRLALELTHPWSVMSAYNRVNGVFASEHAPLLRDILKEDWGYDGVVVSDWYGTYTDDVPAGGLDLEMPGPARWMDPAKIVAAVTEGRLAEEIIHDKVARLLRLIERVMQTPQTPPTLDDQLPRRVAAEALVLLKNEAQLLPLDPQQPQSLAVIGENGKWAQIMGGGSSQVNPRRAVSPLDGIEARVGSEVDVRYALGTPIHRLLPLINLSWLQTPTGEPGLALEYFHNLELAGEAAVNDVMHKTQLSWFGTVNPFVDPQHFSLRLTGSLSVPESGQYQLHLWNIGRARVLVDGELQIDHWEKSGDQHSIITLDLEAERPVSLRVEYITDPESRWRTVRLGCMPVLPPDSIQRAVDLAAAADVAIVVAGLTLEWESEGFDRADMRLPGKQDELIRRVAAANPRTVVVLNAGSPVEMPWIDAVQSVVQQWYGGQDAGHALADVLFGDISPSGKLPLSFPRRLQDNPAYLHYPGENGQVYYGEGIFVGYRYYDKKEIAPLFPFGHGLSYTRFIYSNLRLSATELDAGESLEVALEVTNSGAVAGQEVVQLYVEPVAPRLQRPLRELKAFTKVALEPGETKTVRLTLTQQAFACYDPAQGGWRAQDGEYGILIGASSRDIRLRSSVNRRTVVEEAPVATEGEQLSTVPT